jgi:hypothetical protein
MIFFQNERSDPLFFPFEETAENALSKVEIEVTSNMLVEVGIGNEKKVHSFDLGSKSPPVLVECKSHKWTSGNNVPSAKLTVWNEAMYYFHCAPGHYRKILFVLHDKRNQGGETLAAYYVRNYRHLIPQGVEIWEFNDQQNECELIYGP